MSRLKKKNLTLKPTDLLDFHKEFRQYGRLIQANCMEYIKKLKRHTGIAQCVRLLTMPGMPFAEMRGNMIITSIEGDKNAPSMARVYIDDDFAFCLPQNRVELLKLTEGGAISEETLDYIVNTEVYAAAKSAAVKFLALKLRTSYEIRQKLSQLGYDEDTAERVVENLTEINYINDYNYALKYIKEKTKLKPKSVKLLSMELAQKGISDDIIQNVSEELEIDENDVAYELLVKKYSKYAAFDEKQVLKMKTFLLNKGFSYSQISRALSKFLPD